MPATQAVVLAQLTDILRLIVDDPDLDIAMSTSFREDLEFESLTLIELAGRIKARFGDSANMAKFVVTVGLESLPDLRVGHMVDFIVGSLNEPVPYPQLQAAGTAGDAA